MRNLTDKFVSLERRDQVPRPSDTPVPGTYLVRLVRKGPLIPARIDCVGGLWSVTINGVLQGPSQSEPFLAAGMDRAFLGLRVPEAEYDRRLGWKDIPGHPNATPNRPIDFNQIPVL